MKHKKSTRVFMSLAVAGALLGVAGKTNAAGFAVQEQGVKENGRALSGGAAAAEDATTVFYNPAGMTRLRGDHVAAGLYFIANTTSFSGSATTNPTLPIGGGIPIEGSDGGDPGGKIFFPTFYYSHELNERMRVGMGIGVPFGDPLEYESDWVGRYHTIKGAFKTLNFNPTMAYKINDKLSLGAGVSIMYGKNDASVAVDYSGGCLDRADTLLAQGSAGIVCPALGLNTPGDPRTDGKAALLAEGWGYGFNLGLLYELTEKTRIGLAYRSKIDLEMEGRADFTKPEAEPGTLGLWPLIPPQFDEIMKDTDISMVMKLPPSLSLSLTTRIAPKWDLMTDITWTQWSMHDEMRVKFVNPMKEDTVQPSHYKDALKAGLGLNYHYNTKWSWRGGIAIDKTPIPDAESRTPRIPCNDRKWLAGGLTYAASPALAFDFALVHLFTPETEVNNTEVSTGHHLSGTLETNINIISSQVNWQF